MEQRIVRLSVVDNEIVYVLNKSTKFVVKSWDVRFFKMLLYHRKFTLFPYIGHWKLSEGFKYTDPFGGI